MLAYLAGEDAGLRALFAAAAPAAATPQQMLELVVDGIQQDITLRHTRGCPFINAAAEYPDQGPVRDLVAQHRDAPSGSHISPICHSAGATRR